jgi:protein-disulfide isomerase
VQAGVQGTPAFFVNGQRSAANNWATLEPLLRGQ